MADQAGEADLRATDIDSIVKNYALENFSMLQICTIVPTTAASNVYYQETDSDIVKSTTTAITQTSFEGNPEGSLFPNVEHSWTETTERVKQHGADNIISWNVWKLSAIDVKARMLERIGRAIAKSVDTAIITELATTTNTAAAVATWDNATESLQQPLKDILIGLAGMKIDNWNPHKQCFIILHPTNEMELMNNPVIRNASQTIITSAGRTTTVAGCTLIANNASTENTVLMAIGKSAMTWYQAQPLTTYVKEDPGQTLLIRAYQMGVPVLINNNAAWKITGC